MKNVAPVVAQVEITPPNYRFPAPAATLGDGRAKSDAHSAAHLTEPTASFASPGNFRGSGNHARLDLRQGTDRCTLAGGRR